MKFVVKDAEIRAKEVNSAAIERCGLFAARVATILTAEALEIQVRSGQNDSSECVQTFEAFVRPEQDTMKA